MADFKAAYILFITKGAMKVKVNGLSPPPAIYFLEKHDT